MTREEAIEILIAVAVCDRPILSCDFCARYVGMGTDCTYPSDKEIEEAVLLLKGASKDLAISALRQQEHFREVTKKVESLTLDELRQMDGEPVWWWNKSAKPVCTICVWDRFMDEPMFANYDWQSEDTLKLSKYKWLKKCGYKPYRQKPEEETK